MIQRKIWIDWFKVLEMVLIVWGHCSPQHLSAFVYAFSVPLFFFISGYLSRKQSKLFGKKIVETLLIPMFLICFINLLMDIIIGKTYLEDVGKSLLLIIGGFHSLDGILGCGGMWFVYTLTIIKCIHNSSSRFYKVQIFLSVCFLTMSYFLNISQFNIANAWLNVLLAYPFFCIGYWCSFERLLYKMEFVNNKYALIISCFLFLIIYILASYNGIVYMYLCSFGKNMILFIGGSILGIWLMWIISMSLNKWGTKILETLSNGTILMLGFQSYFIRLLTIIIRQCGVDRNDWVYDVITFFGSCVIVLFFYPFILLTKKYFPILLGKR